MPDFYPGAYVSNLIIYYCSVIDTQGQNVCTYYSHYGICKFGPACKFDHPINLTSNASEVDSTSAFSNAMTDGANIAGSGNGIEAATQQPM